MKTLHAVLFAASTSLLATSAVAGENFNYNYVQIGASFNKTEFNVLGKNPDFSGRGINTIAQYSPAEGVYVKGIFNRGSIDKSKTERGARVAIDGKSSSLGALAGLIVPLAEGVDLRGGLGIARNNDSYNSTVTLISAKKTTAKKTDRTNTGVYGEAGLKFYMGEWGNLDLLYSRLNKANYFSIGGNTPITENFGIELGYTISPEGPDRERLGSWNLGARFYF